MCDGAKADKCAGVSGPPKRTSSGLFSMFGGDSGSCGSCGKDKCSCNCQLTDHLKKCAGLGNLPPLIEKCDDIPGPGFRDRCPKSTCADKKDCFACGKPAPPPPPPKVEETKCEPEPPKCEEKKVEKKCEEKPKCPPMPVTDCTDCKPKWVLCPPSLSKTYAVPEGVEVLPISVGGRNGTKGGNCGKCGQDKGPPGKPKVSSGCPMMKPRCPGLEANNEGGGFFDKIKSMFGGGKK